MPPLTTAGIRALVSLLDDRAPGVAKRCREQLFAEGERALLVLREFSKSKASPPGRGVARHALRELEDLLVDREVSQFAVPAPAELDLESGALLIARTHNPGLDVEPLRTRFDEFAGEVLSRLAPGMEPRDEVAVFVGVLHEGARMTGNRDDYYDPRNSLLDQVLIRGLGIPISLSVVYLLTARRAGVPMYGIGMPGHFVLRCGGMDGVYFDPFEGGRSLTSEECDAHVRRAGFAPSEALMEPLPDRYILARMIANLIHVYQQRSDAPRVERMQRMFAQVRGEITLA